LDEPSSVERLWEEFKLKASAHARERLILHYAPLVKYVAGRVSVGLPPTIEQADLVSYGIFGLIDAIEKYDLERGIKFETHAISRIKGAIIDELRAIDWIPRSVRFKAREVEKAYVALENRLHRSPTDAEVAQQLGITTDELTRSSTRSRSCRWSPSTSLVDTLGDKGAENPVAVFESQEMKGILAGAINRLGERGKIVITLYYYYYYYDDDDDDDDDEGLTLAEIGQVLGVTESRVCQMHTKAVLQLRAKMQDAR
jgi:RNA polymerase sigma factor FliA